jgi:hypothetical protein
MTQFTILHHGVPLGTAFTTPSDEEGGNPFALNTMDFAPAPAYESVRRLTRHAADAFCGWFIGPLVDWEAAEKDLPAAEQMWAELELADEQGKRVAGRVVAFFEQSLGGKPSYWVDVELDDASADVPARRLTPPSGESAHNQLPPNANRR